MDTNQQDPILKLEMSEQYRHLTEDILQLIEDAPLYFVEILCRQIFWAVLGQLRAGYSKSVWLDDITQKDLEQFEQLLNKKGIKIGILKPRVYMNEPDNLETTIYFYNPILLTEESKRLSEITSSNCSWAIFNPNETLKEWFDRCSSKIPKEALYGILYSFPTSSIKQFLNQQIYQGEKHTESHYGETYVYWGEKTGDILKKEERKNNFYSELSFYINDFETYLAKRNKASSNLIEQRMGLTQ